MKKTISLLIATAISLSVSAQQYPYQNPNLDFDTRTKDLLSRLTIEEKSQLMCDQSPEIPRLGIKAFNWWSEALHGMGRVNDVTVFPEPIGMAASFDEDLLYQVFDATSDEFRGKYNDAVNNNLPNIKYRSLSVWTPNVNIFRDPRWGRGMETYGEDPYLTSRMGVQVVKGLQNSNGSKYLKLLACAKHFAVHSGPEWSRHTLNVNNVSNRDLYETYLPAFKALVQEADVREVMCAYQRLDDEPCCGNTRLLQRILREDWGFKYMVVSDCGAISDFHDNHKTSSDAIHSSAKGILSGTDVECFWNKYVYMNAPEAVKRGLLRESDIDKCVYRLLYGRFSIGEMDSPEVVEHSKIGLDKVDSKEHRQLALKMAQESMVLLQNKNNVLPLKKSVKKIAIIGPNANSESVLRGNYNGVPTYSKTVLDGVKSKISENAIYYDLACDLVNGKVTSSYIDKCSFEGKKGIQATYKNNREFSGDVVATVYITDPIKLTTAGNTQFANGVNLEGFSGRYQTEFKAEKDEKLVFNIGVIGTYKLSINGDSIASKRSWQLMPSKAYYDVKKGETYKIQLDFVHMAEWQAYIDFDFGTEVDLSYDKLIENLKGIDIVVFVGGLSNHFEGEEMPVDFPGFKGGDRTNIELPDVQRNCLKALKNAGKKVVFVSMSGSAIAFTPETSSCDAILQAWYGGQEGGQAIADVLFGDVNPSGKLPISFYRNSDNLGDFEDYSMENRTYRFTEDVLFPFGYGLNYSKVQFGKPSLSAEKVSKNSSIKITIPIKNLSKINMTEVVQVYITKDNDQRGPIKSLRGFVRQNVDAGKTVNAVVELPYNSFEFFDYNTDAMNVTPGTYTIWVGNSSAKTDLQTIKVTVD
ncbi:MAG: glycoside hydrolase family 3 C-terminal domain-containing protein [Bacteroidales bacterium]|nr:glycoside hydrolase family 3 C-terminal domain-containing protein [Bacteroidales bacterium]